MQRPESILPQRRHTELRGRLRSRDDVLALATSEGIPFETLLGIWLSKVEERVRRNMASFRGQAPAVLHEWQRQPELALADIAHSLDIPGTVLVRLVLAEWQRARSPGDSETRVKAAVSAFVRRPDSIPDARLAGDVRDCIAADRTGYNPSMDSVRLVVGQEYEFVLAEMLRAARIPFLSEDDLRERGTSKTPDVQLKVPMLACGGKYVVCWIDSKAMFGDAYRHRSLEREQYFPYVNRFGPGLVIYWFGFVEEMNASPENGILLANDLPDLKFVAEG